MESRQFEDGPNSPIQVDPWGESGLLIRFAAASGDALGVEILGWRRAIEQARIEGIGETIPGLDSLAVHFDPRRLDHAAAARRIVELGPRVGQGRATDSVRHEVPVCYDADFGLDLADIAAQAGWSLDRVIDEHAGREYTVRMVGFTPGFPYLAGLPAELWIPRRSSPRTSVPSGSVGIAGGYCGIYPRTSPGGWRLLGRTPISLFDPRGRPPNRLAVGDRIRFRRISISEFQGWSPGS
jgi:KipI family sensor histidine kinase inhibitor